MIYRISDVVDKKLQEFYNQAMSELNDFFEIKWGNNPPSVVLIPDRKTYSALRGRKTESWEIGWGKPGDNNIFLLDRENFEAESRHTYSDEKYYSLLKHELAHRYSSVLSKNTSKPIWLLEGISVFAAGQNKQQKVPEKFTNFLQFHDQGGADVYTESGFVVQYLVEKFGKNKLIKLLTQIGSNQTKESFADLFKKIYAFDLSYEELSAKLIPTSS